MTLPTPPRPGDPLVLEALRGTLERAGFTESELGRGLGARPGTDPGPADGPVHLRRLDSELPLHTLARLFLYDLDAEAVRAMLALAPAGLDDLEAMGLLRSEEGGVRGPVRLAPFEDLLFASDHIAAPPMDHGHVLGVNQAARTLRQATIERPVRSALDVGTGCGPLALALAPQAEQVTGVDISARALEYARFNAALNGIENVAFEQGSWFEPVEGRTFDLITCNPPFVISPDTDLEFRDSGMSGDLVSRGLIAAMGGYLNEGGHAQMLCNWIHEPGDEWAAPVREWVEGTGCDALVVRYFSQDPTSYAATWNARLRTVDEAEFERTMDRWLEYYRGLGIEAIGSGLVTLRRRSDGAGGGPPWYRALDSARPASGRAGEQVARAFEGADVLAGGEPALLERALGPVAGLRFDREVGAGAHARAEPGLGVEVKLSAEVCDVLLACDGRRSLREVVTEVAAHHSRDEGQLAAESAEGAGRLLTAGLLTAGPVPPNLSR